MAEGFARTYGSDVIEAVSAGLAPAMTMPPLTRKVMLEKNIDLGEHFPKGVDAVIGAGADLIINMSGQKLPAKSVAPVEDWLIRDPIGQNEEIYRVVRDEIEHRVMKLILGMRAKESSAAVDTQRQSPRQ